MPPLSIVPTTEPTTTPGGKPTVKSLGVRRRVELYRDLCAGLVLRLIHETFRVLPLTQVVECVAPLCSSLFVTTVGTARATGLSPQKHTSPASTSGALLCVEWAMRDLNPRPRACEARALTS